MLTSKTTLKWSRRMKFRGDDQFRFTNAELKAIDEKPVPRSRRNTSFRHSTTRDSFSPIHNRFLSDIDFSRDLYNLSPAALREPIPLSFQEPDPSFDYIVTEPLYRLDNLSPNLSSVQRHSPIQDLYLIKDPAHEDLSKLLFPDLIDSAIKELKHKTFPDIWTTPHVRRAPRKKKRKAANLLKSIFLKY